MRIKDIITEGWAYRNRNQIYRTLIAAIDSGPFDGGCVVFARALQIKFGGGEIVVMVNSENDRAEHAALQYRGQLYDADGVASIGDAIRRFRRLEHVWVDDIRPIEPRDLPDAPRDQELSAKISEML